VPAPPAARTQPHVPVQARVRGRPTGVRPAGPLPSLRAATALPLPPTPPLPPLPPRPRLALMSLQLPLPAPPAVQAPVPEPEPSRARRPPQGARRARSQPRGAAGATRPLQSASLLLSRPPRPRPSPQPPAPAPTPVPTLPPPPPFPRRPPGYREGGANQPRAPAREKEGEEMGGWGGGGGEVPAPGAAMIGRHAPPMPGGCLGNAPPATARRREPRPYNPPVRVGHRGARKPRPASPRDGSGGAG